MNQIAPASLAPGLVGSEGTICDANASIVRASAGVRIVKACCSAAAVRAHAASSPSIGSCRESQLPPSSAAELARNSRRVPDEVSIDWREEGVWRALQCRPDLADGQAAGVA